MSMITTVWHTKKTKTHFVKRLSWSLSVSSIVLKQVLDLMEFSKSKRMEGLPAPTFWGYPVHPQAPALLGSLRQ